MGDIIHNVGSSTSAIRPDNKPVITVATGDITLDTGADLVIPDADVKTWNNKVIPHTIDTSAVDMTTEGTYAITYTAVDMLGRTTIESRNVVVTTPVVPSHYYFISSVDSYDPAQGSWVRMKFKFDANFAGYSNLSGVSTVMTSYQSQGGVNPKTWGTIGTILYYAHSTQSSERKASSLIQFAADQPGVSAELLTTHSFDPSIGAANNFTAGSGGQSLTYVP